MSVDYNEVLSEPLKTARALTNDTPQTYSRSVSLNINKNKYGILVTALSDSVSGSARGSV